MTWTDMHDVINKKFCANVLILLLVLTYDLYAKFNECICACVVMCHDTKISLVGEILYLETSGCITTPFLAFHALGGTDYDKMVLLHQTLNAF